MLHCRTLLCINLRNNVLIYNLCAILEKLEVHEYIKMLKLFSSPTTLHSSQAVLLQLYYITSFPECHKTYLNLPLQFSYQAPNGHQNPQLHHYLPNKITNFYHTSQIISYLTDI